MFVFLFSIVLCSLLEFMPASSIRRWFPDCWSVDIPIPCYMKHIFVLVWMVCYRLHQGILPYVWFSLTLLSVFPESQFIYYILLLFHTAPILYLYPFYSAIQYSPVLVSIVSHVIMVSPFIYFLDLVIVISYIHII